MWRYNVLLNMDLHPICYFLAAVVALLLFLYLKGND